jgi:hypothetical protein
MSQLLIHGSLRYVDNSHYSAIQRDTCSVFGIWRGQTYSTFFAVGHFKLQTSNGTQFKKYISKVPPIP